MAGPIDGRLVLDLGNHSKTELDPAWGPFLRGHIAAAEAQHASESHGAKVAGTKEIFILCVSMYAVVAVLWALFRRIPPQSSFRPHAHVVLLCASWSSTSIGMQVINKTLVNELHAPAFISVIQMWIAVIAMAWPSLQSMGQLTGKQVATWLIVPVFFASMLCTSFYTYEYISLSLGTVIRNLTPFVVFPIERAVMQPEKQPRLTKAIIVGMLLMLAGALIYAGGIDSVSPIGLCFALANMLLAASDRLIQRRLLTTECQGLPSAVCTFLNNLLGSLPALWLAVYTGQVSDVHSSESWSTWMDPRIGLLLLLSGLVGIGICYLGFECQRVISATSFFVLQNVSKMGVVLCGIVFFGDPIKSPLIALGLLCSLGGSLVYGRAQMQASSGAQKAT